MLVALHCVTQGCLGSTGVLPFMLEIAGVMETDFSLYVLCSLVKLQDSA